MRQPIARSPWGNTTTLGDQTLAYDQANRHTTTTLGSTTVSYTRDATNRIVGRTATGETAVKYGFTGAGDAPDFTLDAATGAVVSRTLALPGGVAVTLPRIDDAVVPATSGGARWSYPNIHGDVGCDNAYAYPNDPVNAFDLDGRSLWSKLKSVGKWIGDNAGTISMVAGGIAMFATGPVGLALGGIALAAGAWSAKNDCSARRWLDCGLGVAGTLAGGFGLGVRGAIRGVSWLQNSKYVRGGARAALRSSLRHAVKPALRTARGAAGAADTYLWGASVSSTAVQWSYGHLKNAGAF